ncbi:MAG: hypothetical protein M3088_06470 [Actinomycetota bacterium]|nr:hypothetical protein [Actinomycetota bacterium]
MLGELESNGRFVICDLEAGIGPVVRSERADVVLAVTEPTVKSIEVARRAVEIAAEHAPVVVIANRVRTDEDVDAVRAVLGDQDLVVVPEEPGIAAADRDGAAPIDTAPDSVGVRAIVALAERLGERAPAVAA